MLGGREETRTLHTDRLLLRPFRPSDAAALSAVVTRGREHLAAAMPWLAVADDLAAITALVHGFAASEQRGERHFAVIHRVDGALLGGVVLGEGAIGYWLDPARLGQGYATEAVAAVARLALGPLALDRVVIHAAPGNPRSAAVAARLGFTPVDDTSWSLARADSGEPAWRQALDAAARAFDEAVVRDADSAEVTWTAPDGARVLLTLRRAWAYEQTWLVVSSVIATSLDVSPTEVLEVNGKIADGALALVDGAVVLRYAGPLAAHERLVDVLFRLAPAAWSLRAELAHAVAPRGDVFTAYAQ